MESGEKKGKRKEEGESEGTFPLSLPHPLAVFWLDSLRSISSLADHITLYRKRHRN